MSAIEIGIISLYIAGLLFILLFCLTQLYLAIYYLRHQNESHLLTEGIDFKSTVDLPLITVQLPIYNEMYVVERLIDAVVQFDYPKDKFQIQVLDDSTDETLEISKRKIDEYQAAGFDISLMRRKDRKGFKAGALQEGWKTAKGEFIAIFDADFVPNPDFLKKTIPYFQNPEIGLIQTKWQHLNKSYSILTRIQAFALDAHFNLEQTGRNLSGAFMNFNGTAGVWRKTCINDAGGWSHDTLTEDLDLSYRAQLKGWKFLFLKDIGSPAELPAAMNAIKSQQYRWSKGPAEVSKKLLLKVLASKASWKVKWAAFFHLLNSSINIFIIITAVLSVPLLFIKSAFHQHWVFSLLYFFYTGILAIGLFYLLSQIIEERSFSKGIKSFAILFPTFLSLTMGLSLHNGLAALKGLFGFKTAFVRTPKHHIIKNGDSWVNKKYASSEIGLMNIGEVLMAFYFMYGMSLAFTQQQYELLFFHFLLAAGFLGINYFTIKHAFISVKS